MRINEFASLTANTAVSVGSYLANPQLFISSAAVGVGAGYLTGVYLKYLRTAALVIVARNQAAASGGEINQEIHAKYLGKAKQAFELSKATPSWMLTAVNITCYVVSYLFESFAYFGFTNGFVAGFAFGKKIAALDPLSSYFLDKKNSLSLEEKSNYITFLGMVEKSS